MHVNRRDFLRGVAGSGAAAAIGQLGLTASLAATTSSFRAMVGIFLFGGNDGWNMVVPTDARYATYAASRGAIALPQADLVPLAGSAFGLHPAMAALQPLWTGGKMGVVLNAGTLHAPLTKATYQSRADLRPVNLMSHADEQAHWQGLRARTSSRDGFMGRMADRMGGGTLPPLVSLGGSQLALIGTTSSPLVLPSTGTIGRSGYSATTTNAAQLARQAAGAAFADAAGTGQLTELTAKGISTAYDQMATASGVLSATSTVDQHFVNPATGAALTSDIARQLMRIARLIEASSALGHARQVFFASQGGYDTHANQIAGTPSSGNHAGLLGDLALAMAAFSRAMDAIGSGETVTAFTMSDFGRTFRANAQRGTDHAWGNNHLVVGGGLRPRTIHGAYPDPVIGGSSDISGEGRFVPGIAQEEYIGAIARWHGVAGTDMPHVFPNWDTWTQTGRGPLALFA